MQISHNTSESQRIAKVAITRPSVVVSEILGDKDVALKTIHALRVYPNALISLMRADNMPKWMKADVEDALEEVGYLMMT